MIELEHHGICLAAVDTWMRLQVIGDEHAIRPPIENRPCPGPAHIRREVLFVVLLPVRAAAGPAVRPVRAARGVLDRELGKRFCQMAACTDAGRQGIGHATPETEAAGPLRSALEGL